MRLQQMIKTLVYNIRQMDIPTLRAFVSPRNNFYLRTNSSEDQFKSGRLKLSSKEKGRCPSSRLGKTGERVVLNQYIKDLQGSIINECKKIQQKIKSVHEKAPQNGLKENVNAHNSIFKSCQNLKKYASKTILQKSTKIDGSLKLFKKSAGKNSEDGSKTKHKSKQGFLEKVKPNLQLSQETDWIPNKKLQGLLGHVYTTTNALTKNFEREVTPKPKIIRSLFHNKINSDDDIGTKKPALYPDTSMKDFKVVRKLGKGRFGNVYLAQQKTTGFLVAIKSIQKKMVRQNDMVKQIKQQIKIQLFVDHPNILKMHGFFDDLQNIYLILEAIPLGNIFRQLKEEKRFSEKKTAAYLKQVCEALGCLHHNQVLHRDIKPENILNGYGVLKLSDFGWSIYSPQEARQTFCGTLDYVSPEVVVGKSYNFMVDVWSIGVLAYEFATGHAPFQNKGGTQDQTYQKILRTRINFPQFVSEGMRDFINRILVKNPKKRMILAEAINHDWLVENCKGGIAVSKSIYNTYLKLI